MTNLIVIWLNGQYINAHKFLTEDAATEHVAQTKQDYGDDSVLYAMGDEYTIPSEREAEYRSILNHMLTL